ncbi:hypothetical protein RvY_15785-2 [Ramazzottius varieornatus]|uniref:COMM domain-containing protein n=1 Tax=Ramazzottius varieornatus TaxID=947166 RepID=A0A1D1VZ79_RAMVA|nr:hypothetical protein RvY_15785-2 [Ramazzottius varieornatus]
MKFKFCGDLDCPDWALAAITSITRLSSVKFRQLSHEIGRMLCDETKNVIASRKICVDARLNLGDTKTVIAATEFFLSNAVTHKVNAEVFSNELQQLGFPKEHAAALTKVYQSDGQQLAHALEKSGFRVSKLLHTEWIPDIVLSECQDQSVTSSPGLILSMRIQGMDNEVTSHSFLISMSKLRILKHEVADMLQVMDSLSIPRRS